MSERPDWIKCVADIASPQQEKTWCGRRAEGWYFVSADHAALAGRNGSRLVVCPQCREALVAALSAGAEELA